eukprot:c33403_g1_i1.p1 GENE.c33403_g1_i1~~c33403_g1_i1.p1  ORF type:complete len:407 (-),score=55.06 c33403_g1_i1:47-1240(-)
MKRPGTTGTSSSTGRATAAHKPAPEKPATTIQQPAEKSVATTPKPAPVKPAASIHKSAPEKPVATTPKPVPAKPAATANRIQAKPKPVTATTTGKPPSAAVPASSTSPTSPQAKSVEGIMSELTIKENAEKARAQRLLDEAVAAKKAQETAENQKKAQIALIAQEKKRKDDEKRQEMERRIEEERRRLKAQAAPAPIPAPAPAPAQVAPVHRVVNPAERFLPPPVTREHSESEGGADPKLASAEIKRQLPVLIEMLSSHDKLVQLKGLQTLVQTTQATYANDDVLLFMNLRRHLARAAMGPDHTLVIPALQSLYNLAMVDENKELMGHMKDLVSFLVAYTAGTGDNVAGGILNNICTVDAVRVQVVSHPKGLEVLHLIATQGLPVDYKPVVQGAWVK